MRLTTRRDVLRSVALVQAAPARPVRPNFLLLHTDDQRFDTIRALGNPDIQTPNMDRLVARGVTFTQATTQGGLVPAVCMPSRAQFLTGLDLFRASRAIVDRTANPDPAVLTFAEHLRARGYRTFHSGKWHLGPVLHHRSFTDGAEIFFGGMADHVGTPVQDYQSSGEYRRENVRHPETFSSELIANASIRFLESATASADRPFLLYSAFTSPHDPRTPPERFRRLYSPDRMKLPPNFLAEHPFDNGDLKIRDELLAQFPRTETEIKRHIAEYYAMISEVDAQIGRILDALEASGVADRTHIIFAGDNGLAVGQHGLMGKQNLYDHSLRVPLIVCGPGIAKGTRDASLVHLMDIAPTICDAAGSPLPGMREGRNLLSGARRTETISAYRTFQRALRSRDWKLIRYHVNGKTRDQLFDLKNDPWERNDLAADSQHEARVREMATRLRSALEQSTDDTQWTVV